LKKNVKKSYLTSGKAKYLFFPVSNNIKEIN
jgi:hypothetical protein